MDVDEFFRAREAATADKLRELADSFAGHLGKDGKRELAGGCLYAVGSAGRGELGASSDLDVFIVTDDKPTKIRETMVATAVIRTMREHKLPDPSNDALFLRLYGAEDLERRLGDVTDDAENTFTARMLLLLESRPLFGTDSYSRLLERVVKAYWRNNERHAHDYLPMVLVNDVVRYWRVVLLNYEAKYARKLREIKGLEAKDRELEALAAEKRFASYKLRFSRCMTCYSMITRLLAETSSPLEAKQHVSVESVLGMIRSTPVQRIQQVRDISVQRGEHKAANLSSSILAGYRSYLETRALPDEAVTMALSSDQGIAFKQADEFGETMFHLLQELGAKSPLYRFVVV
jgi:hypothetical protein